MKPSIMNESNVHESMDTILQDVQRTILQTNEIERFAVFSREKTIRPRPYHLSHLFIIQWIMPNIILGTRYGSREVLEE